MGQSDGDDDAQHRQRRALHAHRQAGDDVGSRAGLGSLGDVPDRLAPSVVLGQQANYDAGERPGKHGPEYPGVEVYGLCEVIGASQKQGGGEEGSVPQRRSRIDILHNPHAQHTDERGHQADHDHGQRVAHGHQLGLRRVGDAGGQLADEGGGGGSSDGDGGDHRADVGLEDVGAHAGHVTHVVAHVVGDHCRVARVVFRNARLDLAHQVGTDVGRLGEDATADAGEQGDRARAHGKAADRLGVVDVAPNAEGGTQCAYTEHAEAGHGQPHYRAAHEGHVQRRPLALVVGRLRGADIGPGGRLHAGEAGHNRAGSAG